ncbi:epoxide hydrolase [Paecilomyces variotii]|uniref:Epoxide hydrolase n=1 Tax=Byssochlamys spectabilis TaxID=264951 RepID=A0A443HS43_BYSSP|nr:epoxide hydrolase [Paecilomyces variotii]RWQ94641.1 epoxide hydrolase [Paecilomyces variotii]
MAIDKINVHNDPRVQRLTAQVNGKTYGYLLAQPENGQYKDTIFLLHGFPDLSMGWRYQIPLLISFGLRVVVPDCLGYGRTDAPQWTPENERLYGFRKLADDIKELAKQLGSEKIILGGHDWGAALVYRIALYHRDLVTHLFAVCVPYIPPMPQYISHEDLVRTRLPNFAYQLQFKSGEVEKAVKTKEEIKQFLLALYGGRTEDGQWGFSTEKGILFDRLGRLGSSKLLEDEELNYYVDEFSRNGIHGPLNWYRTRDVNYKDELSISNPQIDIPVLMIQALRDTALPPHMGQGMGKFVPNLIVEQVDTSHWALWEKPGEVNAILEMWFKDVVFSVPALGGGKL